MADDRIRELEIMIRLINIEIILGFLSMWQQVVLSVVLQDCMTIHELCTDVETVSGRT